MNNKKESIVQMEQGKIYFVSYGQTTLVIRYKESDIAQHFYYDALHNWCGYEAFFSCGFLEKIGIEFIREASDAEKQSLLRKSIEHKTI